MKISLMLNLLLFAVYSNTHAQQCPSYLLKIESPVCDTPQNLRVNMANCTSAQLSWKGNKEQKYVIMVTGTDAAANIIFETKKATYSCDAQNNCSATINVREGEIINWNVQAICNVNGIIIYSPVIEGRETIIPHCQSITSESREDNETKTVGIKIYPNPTTGKLTVEYYSKSSGPLQLTVFDMSSRAVFKQSANAIAGRNNYLLNLHQLTPGAYMLEAKNGKNFDRVKFVILKN